jgi:hypothetical protein
MKPSLLADELRQLREEVFLLRAHIVALQSVVLIVSASPKPANGWTKDDLIALSKDSLRDALNAQTRRAKQSQGQPPTGGQHGQN